MKRLTKEEITAISDEVNKKNLYETSHDRTGEIYYGVGGKITVQPRPCQAYVSQYSNPRVIGVAITHSYTAGGKPKEHVAGKQEFMHFLLGLDKEPSPYQKLINYLGDRLHIVYKDGTDTIIGYYVESPSDINHKYIVNFLKANRTVTEHADRMPLWMQLKDYGNKSLAYMLMYFFTANGEHAGKTGHAPVESSYIKDKCNLKNFAQPLDNNWKLTSDAGGINYSGENNHCWGLGKFDPLKNIRSADYKDVKTFFWSKYSTTTPKRMDIASFKKFIEDVNKGLYNEYM